MKLELPLSAICTNKFLFLNLSLFQLEFLLFASQKKSWLTQCLPWFGCPESSLIPHWLRLLRSYKQLLHLRPSGSENCSRFHFVLSTLNSLALLSYLYFCPVVQYLDLFGLTLHGTLSLASTSEITLNVVPPKTWAALF